MRFEREPEKGCEEVTLQWSEERGLGRMEWMKEHVGNNFLFRTGEVSSHTQMFGN